MDAPKGRHIFGTVRVGEKGQIVIPKAAREVFGIRPGDSLLVLGDEAQGIALVKASVAAEQFASIMDALGRSAESREPQARKKAAE